MESQISFTQFAQAQAVPAAPFNGAYTPRRGLTSPQVAGGVLGDWFIDWQADGNLDATDHLPRGSHQCVELGAYGHFADGLVYRS